MKREFYYLNNYRGRGDTAISRTAIETLATMAVNSVKGASVSKRGSQSRLFNLERPVKAKFRMDGKIEIHVDVSVKKAEVNSTCLNIQEAVASSVMMMCEALPFSVEVRVVSVI